MAAAKLSILGQGAPTAAGTTALYTVPTGRRAVISTLVVCETDGVATGKIRVWLCSNGAATAKANAVVYDVPVDPNQHSALTEGWTVDDGDVLNVYSSSGTVTFTACGTEEDNV